MYVSLGGVRTPPDFRGGFFSIMGMLNVKGGVVVSVVVYYGVLIGP